MTKRQQQVLIVGGGLAGMVTAYRLQQVGISYSLIEARDRLGGRIHTLKTAGGDLIEMGATWFAPKHRSLMALLQELTLTHEPQYLGRKVLYDYQAGQQRVVEEIEIPPHQEPSYLLSQGSTGLIRALEEKTDPTALHLGEALKAMTFTGEGWQIVTNRRFFEVEVVISTLPPNLLVNHVGINPRLPDDLQSICRSTHSWMGESIKAGLSFNGSPWRDQELGSMFSQFGPFTELHDHRHQGSGSILKGFMIPPAHFWTPEQRQETAMQQVSRYFPDLQRSEPDYYETDWQKEEFTFFPYVSEVLPHQNNGHPLLRQAYFDGHLYLAGSEAASSFPGYMDGAVERAEEVARILQAKWSLV